MLQQVFPTSVKFFSYSACMVSQQRHFGMHQHRLALRTGIVHGLLHGFVTTHKIASIHLHPLQSLKAAGIFIRVHGTDFIGCSADAPLVVLYQVNNR